MLTAKELDFQRAVLAVRRRLLQKGRLVRSDVRLSCLGWSDDDFQRLLDAIVSEGVAIRETGKRGAEWYRSVTHA